MISKNDASEESQSEASCSKNAQKKRKLFFVSQISKLFSCSCSQNSSEYTHSSHSLPITLGKLYRREGDISKSVSQHECKVSSILLSNTESVIDPTRQTGLSAEQHDNLDVKNLETINLKSLKLYIDLEEQRKTTHNTTETNVLLEKPEVVTVCDQTSEPRVPFKKGNHEDINLFQATQSKKSDTDLRNDFVNIRTTPAFTDINQENQESTISTECTEEEQTLVYLFYTESTETAVLEINPTEEKIVSEKMPLKYDPGKCLVIEPAEHHQIEKKSSKENPGMKLLKIRRSVIKSIEKRQLNENASENDLYKNKLSKRSYRSLEIKSIEKMQVKENASKNRLHKNKPLKILPLCRPLEIKSIENMQVKENSSEIDKNNSFKLLPPSLSVNKLDMYSDSVLDIEDQSEFYDNCVEQEMYGNIAMCFLFGFLLFICLIIP